MIDERTPNFDLPLPHPENLLTEDVARLRQALSGIDGELASVGAQLAGVAQSLSSAVADQQAGLQSAAAFSAAVKRAVDAEWLYRGERIQAEMFAAGYRLSAHAGVAVVQAASGADTIDLADTTDIREGHDYLLHEGEHIALVRVTAVLTAQRIRISSNLSRTWSTAAKLSGMTMTARPEGGVDAPVGSQWVSRAINLGNDTRQRAVVIRRSHNAGEVRLHFRDDYTTAWTERPWSVRRIGGGTSGVPEGFADYEYLVPMRGDGFLRIETDGEPMVILHIVGLGGVTGLGGQINPAMYPLAPAITSPANGATEVGEMPTIALSGFSSPAGNAFANATYQISTSASFATILHEATVAALSYALPAGVLATSTTYYVRARVTDAAGLTSAWSTANAFTTKTSFAYVNTPSITSPTNGQTNIPAQPTLQSSAFAVTGGSDTHVSSQWQIRLASGSWASPLHDSGETATNKTSYQVPAGILQAGQTQYVCRVRHKGNTLGWSEWSQDVSFTTKQQFAQIIGLVQVATGGGAGTYQRIDENFNAIANPGAAWFNNHPTFGGIVEQTIDGQAMVKIPKFWFKAGTVPSGTYAGKAYWMISDQPAAGFSVHPAFVGAGGVELDQIWVGKYQASASDGKLQSVPGVLPHVNMNFPTARAEAYARNVGGVSGFRLWSAYDLAAIQMLATIELGGLDMQSLVAQGRVSQSSAANVNASDVVAAQYRGITGLWGNVWQMTDGLKRSGGNWWRWQYNVPGNTTTSDFATGYVNTGRAAPTSSGYPVTFDTTLLSAGIIAPATVDDTASNGSTGDYFWSNTSTDDRVLYHGGYWSFGAGAGLFCLNANDAPSYAYSHVGARLAKV